MKNITKTEFIEHLKLDIGALKEDALSLCHDMHSSSKKPILKAYIDATHSGRLTNLRVYPGKQMKASVDTFMKPIGKPLLKHHDDSSDPLGRVFSADYVQLLHGPAFDKDYINPSDGEGSGFIRLGVDIMDADAIEKILDGRFKNVSTRQAIDGLLCSICGEDFTSYESECSHRPGKKYKLGPDEDGDEYLCYGITGPLSYKEVSLVTIPGDAFAEIKSMSFEKKDSMTFDCYEPLKASVKTLVLSDGEVEVDILSGFRNHITAKDKKKLTGKVVIAVGPHFDASKYNKTLDEESSMTKTETKNTDTTTASGSDQTPAQATSTKDQKEGVVAPAGTSEKTSTVGDGGLSEKDSLAVVKSLTNSLQTAEAEAKEAKAESTRFQTALKDKEAEIEALRKQSTLQVTDLKNAYATMLLNSQIILKKTVASTIKDNESYSKKLAEYAERTVESLKDSVKDLSVELVEAKDLSVTRSTKDLIGDKRIDPTTANTKALESLHVTPDVSKDKAIEIFFK